MATLLTHTGLVLFLVAAAVTSRLGFESGILLTGGESQPVRSIGTPGSSSSRASASMRRREDGSFVDFTTDLAVYRDGQELARKVVRVNDPLSVAGYTFHQNGFRPAPDLIDPGRQGSGPVGRSGRADRCGRRGSRTAVQRARPGRRPRDAPDEGGDGTTGVAVPAVPATGTASDGTPMIRRLTPFFVARRRSAGRRDTDFSVELAAASRARRS